MRGSNAAKSKQSTARKSASSSTRSRRPTSVSKSNLPSHNQPNADGLDEIVDRVEVSAVESEAGDRVLEATGTDSGEPRTAVSKSELKNETSFASEEEKPATKLAAAKSTTSQSPSAMMLIGKTMQAVTLHQPWASLIANGSKQYETRNWKTDYRGLIAIHAGKKQDTSNSQLLELAEVKNISELPAGAVVAIVELTDCILMTEEFIAAQSETEKACGNWTPNRYAWKLENVRAIEPVTIAGKQGLWVYNHVESNIAVDAFDNVKSDRPNAADCGEVQHLAEADGQLNLLEWDSNEPPEPDDFPGDLEGFKEAYSAWVSDQVDTVQEEHQHVDAEDIWNQSGVGIGLTCAAELALVSPTQESSNGDAPPTSLSSGTTTAEEFSNNDSPTANNIAMSKAWTLGEVSLKISTSSPEALPVPHSVKMESDSEPTTIETVSPPSSPQSDNSSPTLQLLKTLPDFSTVHTPPATNPEVTSASSLTPYPRAGMTQNGNVFPQRTLEIPGVENDSLLLRSPGALSTTKGRPPGQNRLEIQLQQLGLIAAGEVVAPEFLESGYQLPTGWTNPKETRTAIELNQVQAQQLPIAPSSESSVEMELIETDAQPLETPLIGELQPSLSVELNTLPDLTNLGSFSKESLIEFASAAHISIGFIERKESDLAMQKLDQARIAGLCLKEFKRKCGHGEFESNLNKNGIAERTAQTYMSIARDWDIISQASREIVMAQSQTLSLNWATKVITESKRALKSAAPPADPDCWRTPNTKEQPIVGLVMEALGGEIWCDPCSDAGHRIPARVHYNTSNNGLNARNLWTRTVFVNPPFSDPLPWVDKCCDSIARGDCSQAIMLLKAGTLSNQGTGELIKKFASGICHWRGRINFLNDHGIAVKGSDFDCVLIYFGHRFDRFQETFETFGTVSFIENYYSSVNKKAAAAAVADKVHSVDAVVDSDDLSKSKLDKVAESIGLDNKKSALFPDKRDSDRELMERCDPHTVDDRPFANVINAVEDRAEALAQNQFETAKTNCLNEYITAISGNLSDFSDDQIAFLAKIINEESAKRICGF